MTALTTIVQEKLKETQHGFQEILSDDELEEMFAKYGVQDERKRKLVLDFVHFGASCIANLYGKIRAQPE